MGRNDLSQRQLWLLCNMLNKFDSSPTMLADSRGRNGGPRQIVGTGAGAKQRLPMSSTITLLPSEESGRNPSSVKKRHYSRIGMSGLRARYAPIAHAWTTANLSAAHTVPPTFHLRRRVHCPLM
ncbi:hypothetical protein F5888DRAFT_1763632, partial [Russula emetica]